MFEELENLCKKYNFYCNTYEYSQTAFVQSKRDTWIIEVRDNNKILLKHKNRGSRKIYNTHKQREFLDFEFCVNSIKTHDDFKLFGQNSKVVSSGNIVKRSGRYA